MMSDLLSVSPALLLVAAVLLARRLPLLQPRAIPIPVRRDRRR